MAIKAVISISNTRDHQVQKVLNKIYTLDENKSYNVYITNRKPNRSGQANRYYFGIILRTILDHIGDSYPILEFHEMMKAKFNLKQTEIDGKILEYPGSTSGMSSQEFSEFANKVKMWGEETFGIKISDPREMSDEEVIGLYEQGIK